LVERRALLVFEVGRRTRTAIEGMTVVTVEAFRSASSLPSTP
jgi:hypothetical protein